MANIHQIGRLGDIAKLMDNQKYSDLTIKCEGQTFKVHKSIMCLASKKVAAACDSEMREGQTGVIEEALFDAPTVERMVSYIYKQSYTVAWDTGSAQEDHESVADELAHDGEGVIVKWKDPEHHNEEASSPQERSKNINSVLIAHARMYAIGEYYVLPLLQDLAIDNFVDAAGKAFNTRGFIDVIREVKEQCSQKHQTLWPRLREIALTHIDELVEDEDFMIQLAEYNDVQE